MAKKSDEKKKKKRIVVTDLTSVKENSYDAPQINMKEVYGDDIENLPEGSKKDKEKAYKELCKIEKGYEELSKDMMYKMNHADEYFKQLKILDRETREEEKTGEEGKIDSFIDKAKEFGRYEIGSKLAGKPILGDIAKVFGGPNSVDQIEAMVNMTEKIVGEMESEVEGLKDYREELFELAIKKSDERVEKVKELEEMAKEVSDKRSEYKTKEKKYKECDSDDPDRANIQNDYMHTKKEYIQMKDEMHTLSTDISMIGRFIDYAESQIEVYQQVEREGEMVLDSQREVLGHIKDSLKSQKAVTKVACGIAQDLRLQHDLQEMHNRLHEHTSKCALKIASSIRPIIEEGWMDKETLESVMKNVGETDKYLEATTIDSTRKVIEGGKKKKKKAKQGR